MILYYHNQPFNKSVEVHTYGVKVQRTVPIEGIFT